MYLCTLWMEGELYQPPLSVSPFLSMKMPKTGYTVTTRKKRIKRTNSTTHPKMSDYRARSILFSPLTFPPVYTVCDG